MALPQIGHLDPAFISLAEEVKALLRYVWQTNNAFTIPVSGTGSAAWEAAVANVTFPGDVHLALVAGYFGERHCDMASRYGADVRRVDKPWGEVFSLQEIREALEKHRPQVLWVCHAETSTGALQPVEGIGKLCREFDCLFMLDTVTSIGGLPIFLDDWLVDVCYAGGQKCLSCPPGCSPVSFGPRAIEKMKSFEKAGKKVGSWYLDMNMIAKYLVAESGAPRVYHHTAPISMVYALRQSLQLVADEGLSSVFQRHRDTAQFLWTELEAMGLTLHVAADHRLPSLTTVRIPEGVDGAAVVKTLREAYNIEIGGGLGQLAGKVWRIGLMGFNSRRENVLTVVAALKHAIAAHSRK